LIEGLKLTFSGDEVRQLLEHAIPCHKRSIERWKRVLACKPEEQTEKEPLLTGSHL
jgi:hypothetical protein